jgi:hypothetical protein
MDRRNGWLSLARINLLKQKNTHKQNETSHKPLASSSHRQWISMLLLTLIVSS